MDLANDLVMMNKESKIDLNKLDVSDLEKVIYDAQSLIRRKEYEAREKRKFTAKNDLSIGDIVSVDGKKFKGEIWEVLKLNPKKVQCRRENGETWNISYSSIITK